MENENRNIIIFLLKLRYICDFKTSLFRGKKCGGGTTNLNITGEIKKKVTSPDIKTIKNKRVFPGNC